MTTKLTTVEKIFAVILSAQFVWIATLLIIAAKTI